MKRSYLIAAGVLAVALVAGAIALAYDPKVDVRAGERIECTYGHLVSDDIKTITVPRSEASQYGAKTTKIVCPEHLKAEQLYAEAQQAIAEDDLKAAEKKLAEVVVIDPDFRQAKSQLDQIEDGKTPKPDTSTGGASGGTPGGGDEGDSDGDDGGTTEKPSTPGDSDKPVGPIASLAGWTPDDIDGYKADKIISDVLSLSREYVPTSGDRVELLVISAEQMISADAAEDEVARNFKLSYDQDTKDVKIDGKSGWVGTDGTDTAVLAIVDGPVLVVLQVRSTETDPAKLVADLIDIAETLPR